MYILNLIKDMTNFTDTSLLRLKNGGLGVVHGKFIKSKQSCYIPRAKPRVKPQILWKNTSFYFDSFFFFLISARQHVCEHSVWNRTMSLCFNSFQIKRHREHMLCPSICFQLQHSMSMFNTGRLATIARFGGSFFY